MKIFTNLLTTIVSIVIIVLLVILVKCLAMIPFDSLIEMVKNDWVLLVIEAIVINVAIAIKDAL